jgi:hypothetical protein
VFGWKADSLQKAMDSTTSCMGAACGGLKTQAVDNANKCSVPKRVEEEHDGCKLPFNILSSASITFCRAVQSSGYGYGDGYVMTVKDSHRRVWIGRFR